MKLYTLIYLFNAQKNVGVLVVCTFLVGSLVGYYVHHHNISCIINSLVSAFVRKLPKKIDWKDLLTSHSGKSV